MRRVHILLTPKLKNTKHKRGNVLVRIALDAGAHTNGETDSMDKKR